MSIQNKTLKSFLSEFGVQNTQTGISIFLPPLQIVLSNGKIMRATNVSCSILNFFVVTLKYILFSPMCQKSYHFNM